MFYIPEKNPGLAAVLSFLFTGLGQIYNGDFLKAFLFVVLGGVSIILMFFLIGLFLYPIIWAINIYDAYKSAERSNAAGE